MEINVDFPAPFGPNSPTISPRSIKRFTFFTASVCLYLFDKSTNSIKSLPPYPALYGIYFCRKTNASHKLSPSPVTKVILFGASLYLSHNRLEPGGFFLSIIGQDLSCPCRETRSLVRFSSIFC